MNEKTESIFCTGHKQGPFNKGSELQKEHEKKTKEKCKFVKYDPKKNNPKYKESKISDKSKDNRSQSRILFDFALSKIIKLYIADNNKDEVYALVPINSHTELLNLSSVRAIQWLTDKYSQIIDTDELYGEDFYKKVIHTIKSQCQMNNTQQVKIYRRIAHLDDSIWYDLGDDSWNALKITKKGIDKIALDEKSPLFSRTQSTYQQVTPKYDDDSKALHELAQLLRIKPDDLAVFTVHLVCFFLEAIPIPIMVFDGTAGSIKTTVTSVIKRIVDPSGSTKDDNVSSIAKKPDDLILQLHNRYMSSFDNVNYVDDETSDIFCRTITGSSNTKRKLYTDGSEMILTFKRKIVLNGVVPTLEYPDLQTRLLSYERVPIDETNLISEKEFEKTIEELLPRVLGHILTVLSDTLGDFNKLSKNIKPKTRLADFEIWGEIISQKLGFEKKSFLDRYHEKLKEETIKTQDAYPIISSIQTLMNEKEFHEDSVANLYATLRGITESNGVDLKTQWVKFPKGSNKLVKHLKTIESNLSTCGFVIEKFQYTKHDKKYTQNTTIVRIQRKQRQQTLEIQKVCSPRSPSSPSHNNGQDQAQNDSKNGERNGEGKNETKVSSPQSSSKNNDSRHKIQYGDRGEDGEDKFHISSEHDENNDKPIIIRDVQKAKQRLQNSNFEVWGTGTVKCKFCNGRMDIPDAVKHTCLKRKKSIRDDSF